MIDRTLVQKGRVSYLSTVLNDTYRRKSVVLAKLELSSFEWTNDMDCQLQVMVALTGCASNLAVYDHVLTDQLARASSLIRAVLATKLESSSGFVLQSHLP